MSLLSKLTDNTAYNGPVKSLLGKKPNGPLTKDGKTHELGTYQDYLVQTAASTEELNDDTAFVTRSTINRR
ncbi:hypothetical protein PQZ39_01115 [bacterium]|nr:hypothetical protein [bacterium]